MLLWQAGFKAAYFGLSSDWQHQSIEGFVFCG